MKSFFLIVCVAAALPAALPAQVSRAPEPLSGWPYFKEIHLPRGPAGLADFVLDREALDKARTDHADLRLYDGGGREVPYVLRVRKEVAIQDAFAGREFDRSEEAGSARISCDLGEQPREHNEVEVATGGDNFRRLADVEGSADGERWVILASGASLFRFSAEGRTVEQHAIAYPVSRYRFVRVRVGRDPQSDRATPEITRLRVRRSIRVKGVMTSFEGAVESREADRVSGRPASVWRVDLGGRVPLQRLLLTVGENAFSRPYRVDAIDDPAAPVFLASGELTRREDDESRRPAIDFGERFARRLKLTITDDRNPPLSIVSVTAVSAARQVVFESAPEDRAPIRLYYGNPKALAPRYDLSVRIPLNREPASSRLSLGPQRDNPIYRPEPKPFSERSPWLVYGVLGAACLALAAILLNLMKRLRAGAPPQPPAPEIGDPPTAG